MAKLRHRGALFGALLALLGPSFALAATNLLEAYQQALRNDADFGAAAAERDAGLEEANKGRAGLLPTVSVSGTETRNSTDQRSLTVLGMRGTTYDYTSSSYGISLRQPLYRPYNWAGYLQGQARASYAEATYEAARQDLIVRLAGAYLDALLGQDTLALTQAQRQAYAEQLVQAERLFAGGEGTVTDINDAKARRDSAVAQELEAANNLEVARRALERIIGQEPGTLATLMADKPVPQGPQPNDLNQWVEWARSGNPTVQAQRHGLESARQDVAKAGAEHKPTLDLIASRSKSDSENNVSINTRYDTRAVGVQLNVPLFAGGYVSANVRQAEAGQRKVEQQLESATRKAVLDARQYFLGVNTGVAQINAYRQAVTSAEAALESTRKGFQAGIRTSVDILNAQQQLFAAKRDLARSRYGYIVNWVRLKAAVGGLGDDDVTHLNSWLDVNRAN
ncbi:hypothetical protein B9N43_12795 [Denitratisoma sp. DHT3]|uniref:TolC family outer membrane protein n=1 Tax=Denitratisoma sp. DHT3 TaxID=1981880 RepID=UPI0011983D29|nr:TolC family outer membrane protein [Denitratisoma sp. DHT3]QDX82046.1 hypothetical protein B9N43_12795 [Denitratisoma sp. DHT3]